MVVALGNYLSFPSLCFLISKMGRTLISHKSQMLVIFIIIVILWLFLIIFLGFVYIFITKDENMWSNQRQIWKQELSPKARTWEHEHSPLPLCLTWLHITSRNSPASELSLSFSKLEPHPGRARQLGSWATSEPVVCCNLLTQGSRRQEEQKVQLLLRVTKEARSWDAHTQYVCGPTPSPSPGPQVRPNPDKTTSPVPVPCTHAPWDGFSLAVPLPWNTSRGCFSWWGALISSG